MIRGHSDVRVANRYTRLEAYVNVIKRHLDEVHSLQISQLEKRRQMEFQQEAMREKSEIKSLTKTQALAVKRQPKILKQSESQMKKVGIRDVYVIHDAGVS